MRSHSDKLNPLEIRHLHYISQFTTDIRRIDGTKNEVADALSRPSIVHLQLSSGIDLNEMAAEQRRVGSPCDEDVSGLQPQEALNSAIELCDKEEFQSQLQSLVERLLLRDLLIVAGDWNDRTGPEDFPNSYLLGRFVSASRCENGVRLLKFADQNRLLVNRISPIVIMFLADWMAMGRTMSSFEHN
nr:unnamed protein product [Spirometra erinaceieuropaei]